MVVYADLVFLANTLMDGLLLYMTARARKLRCPWWRLAVTSAVGGAYTVLLFYPMLSFMFSMAAKCMVSALLIWMAFGFGGLRNYVSNIGMFFLISFAAAGGLFAIHYFYQPADVILSSIWFPQEGDGGQPLRVGFLVTAIAFPLMLWLFKMVLGGARRREQLTSCLADVEVRVEGSVYHCKGLIDTGNQLYDPLTRTPVMVMETVIWQEVLPASWVERIRGGRVEELVSGLEQEEFIWQDRLRFVPYRGVNRDTRFMLAIKPDQVVIRHEERTIEAAKVLVALDAGKLCGDGSYQAIVHPMLMSG
ncbi:sigma-E processing peptidase SpoIIGA [Paenibacillus sp. y28]|uniref:sigma-E processing peptidase SpoIIGA n=1 Tax=Paenibacillus sp. y28 TaxID=3129110 RepID=UPI003019242B